MLISSMKNVTGILGAQAKTETRISLEYFKTVLGLGNAKMV
jgi:hypothetical protein